MKVHFPWYQTTHYLPFPVEAGQLVWLRNLSLQLWRRGQAPEYDFNGLRS